MTTCCHLLMNPGKFLLSPLFSCAREKGCSMRISKLLSGVIPIITSPGLKLHSKLILSQMVEIGYKNYSSITQGKETKIHSKLILSQMMETGYQKLLFNHSGKRNKTKYFMICGVESDKTVSLLSNCVNLSVECEYCVSIKQVVFRDERTHLFNFSHFTNQPLQLA